MHCEATIVEQNRTNLVAPSNRPRLVDRVRIDTPLGSRMQTSSVSV
jgi:hypothetical protein